MEVTLCKAFTIPLAQFKLYRTTTGAIIKKKSKLAQGEFSASFFKSRQKRNLRRRGGRFFFSISAGNDEMRR